MFQQVLAQSSNLLKNHLTLPCSLPILYPNKALLICPIISIVILPRLHLVDQRSSWFCQAAQGVIKDFSAIITTERRTVDVILELLAYPLDTSSLIVGHQDLIKPRIQDSQRWVTLAAKVPSKMGLDTKSGISDLISYFS